MVVLRDVVPRVARADHHDPLAAQVGDGRLGRVLVLAAVVDEGAEGGLAGEGGHLGLVRVAGVEDDVLRVEGAGRAGRCSAFEDVDGPYFRGVGVLGFLEGGRGLDVQFHETSVGLEPVSELIFRREGGPALREGQPVHVRVLHWVVRDERAVPATPVVSNACVLLEKQTGEPEVLQPGGDIETGLPCSAHHTRQPNRH